MSVALALLDIQTGILYSDKIPWERPEIPEETVTATATLLAAARGAGVPVLQVGVRRTVARGQFDEIRTAAAENAGKAPKDIMALAAGSDDIGFIHAPGDGEETIHKVGVSCFQGTRLDTVLRNLGARDVVVAGAFTHMVVESTVRQGFDLGYRMAVVPEACCSPNSTLHENSLKFGISNFARIIGLDDIGAFFKENTNAGN